MIAIILAGGYGTRLRPLTGGIAKPLLPVEGKPIIDYIVERLLNLQGIDQIVVSTNERFEGQFSEWLSRRRHRKVKVVAEPSHGEDDKLGAVRALSRLVEGLNSRDYLVVAGDNLFTSGLKDMVEYYRSKGSPVVALFDVGDLEVVKRYGCVEVEADGRITGFVEKPERPKSTLAATCIYALPEGSLKRVREYLEEGNDPDAPGYFVQWLCRRERVYGYVLQGYWSDIGTPESYEDAKRLWRGFLRAAKT